MNAQRAGDYSRLVVRYVHDRWVAQSSRTLRLDVCFSRGAGSHLRETPLADDQTVTETRDGRLRIRATVLDTRQLRWWLSGFGSVVEVMGPKGLRKEFAAVAAELSARYRCADSP